MDGLECSEIYISNLEFSGRIDSEYYQKKHLEYENMIQKNNSCPMGKLCHFLIGPFGSAYDTSTYVDKSDYRYVRGQDVKPFFLQDTSPRYMNESDYHRLRKYALMENDILISVVGTLGNASIVQGKELPAIFSCKSTAVRVDSVDPYYLLSYLNSKYGRQLLLRKERGAIQKGLNLDDLKALDVPVFSKEFQMIVRGIALTAPDIMNKANLFYEAARNELLSALCYTTENISSKTISEKKLSDSFGVSGRLDAEYYQPKYNSILKMLSTNDTVESLCHIHDDNHNPDNNTEYQYIELSDVGLHGEISSTEKIIGNELPTRARRKVKKGQVIISSIEGSLSSCALITEEFDEALCSTGFYVIDSDIINSETLLVLFQSEPIQGLLKQRCSGTILTAISKEEFKKMPLPFIDDAVQKEIAGKVQKAFAMRKKASSLIKIAVKAIELAIEQNEEVATKWLRDNVESLEG